MKHSEASTGLEPSKTIPTARKWNTKNLGWRLASDLTAAATATTLIAPVIAIIDKGIMENASGRNTLKSSITNSFRDLIFRPQTLLFSKPVALIFCVYGGTYITANTLDTATSTVQNKPANTVTSGALKFVAPSAANIGLGVFKDQAFARLFGTGTSRPVTLPSYVLFTIRDCMTIFASFNIPPLLGPVLNKQMGEEVQRAVSGQTIAQFIAPASIQLFSTPLHLLGLDLYNRGDKLASAERWNAVKKNWGISAVARICRILPAFGVGGVVNSKVRKGLMDRLEK